MNNIPSKSTIACRIQRGWDREKAESTPVIPKSPVNKKDCLVCNEKIAIACKACPHCGSQTTAGMMS